MDARGRSAFRDAMARFATGVTIVTTRDASLSDWGITATAFTFVSEDPPLVLFALRAGAGSTPAFSGSERFAVSILSADHEDLAARFATGRPDKFILGGFDRGPFELPVAAGALAVLACRRTETLPGGDHELVIGEVESAQAAEGEALVRYGREFLAVG